MARYNLTQIPKSRDFLKCLRARPGHKIVQLDAAALEPVILTSMSKDEALWSIYGSDRTNDIYLFTAANIKGLGDSILATGYDPYNPTDESIAKAKKACKRDRSVAKVVHLAASYGAGASKIHETLKLSGVTISMEEVENIHYEYWKLYNGVKDFGYRLMREWKRNGNYVLNGFDRPMCVPEDMTKDLVNRVVQSTGHDWLMAFVARIQHLRVTRRVTMYPWISDFHDETMWECPESEALRVAQILKDSLEWTNQFRLTDIPIKGDVEIADSLADIKCEE